MRTVDPAGFKAMIITIWDYDKLGDDFIGALKLRPGMFFGGIGQDSTIFGFPWRRIDSTHTSLCRERYTFC